MQRIVHVLPERTRSVTWIVRTEGVVDVVLKGEDVAIEFGRVIAQRLCNRLAKEIILRKWNRLSRFKDEIFAPDPDHLRDACEARRRTAA